MKLVKTYLLVLFCFLLSKAIAQTPKPYYPTIYNSDYIVPEKETDNSKLDPSVNIFEYIYFYEKEEMNGGFKEIKKFYPNIELLKKLKGEQIYFNPSIIVGLTIPGMYRNSSLRTEFAPASSVHKNTTTTPNIYTVLDVFVDPQTKEIKYLELKKVYDDGTPKLYFSPKEFALKSQSKIGSLADLGMISIAHLNFLKEKYKDKKFIMKYHDGTQINIPESAALPNSHLMKEKQKQNSIQSGAKVLTAVALYDYRYAIFSFLAVSTMQDNYKKLQQQMKEFREKQRKLLYNFEINSHEKLAESSFTENETWEMVEINVLEDSNTPILVMQNSKKQQILVIEELEDLMIDVTKVAEYKTKYGDDFLKKLYEGKYDYGMPINLVRFANGYENSLVSVEVSKNETNEIYGYQNLWLHFKNGTYEKQEWRYFIEPYSEKK
jgi:hypothetical protein